MSSCACRAAWIRHTLCSSTSRVNKYLVANTVACDDMNLCPKPRIAGVYWFNILVHGDAYGALRFDLYTASAIWFQRCELSILTSALHRVPLFRNRWQRHVHTHKRPPEKRRRTRKTSRSSEKDETTPPPRRRKTAAPLQTGTVI